MSEEREIHLERLLGRRVHDNQGRVIGRIEEFRLAVVDGVTIIAEFHLGPDALWERLGGAALHLPFFRALPVRPRRKQIVWRHMDLSDLSYLCLTRDADADRRQNVPR